MPTYVDALFGHSETPESARERLPGFLTIGEDPLVLEGPDVRLYLYPRVALLHHPGTTWWDFTRGERDGVRERTREIARLLGGGRILYLADGASVTSDGGDDDLAADEAFVRERLGPPTPWDAPPSSKEEFRSRWFREEV